MKTNENFLSKGLADYLEILQISGVDDYIRPSLESIVASPFLTLKTEAQLNLDSPENSSLNDHFIKTDFANKTSLKGDLKNDLFRQNSITNDFAIKIPTTNELSSCSHLNQNLEIQSLETDPSLETDQSLETEMIGKNTNNNSEDRVILLKSLAQKVAKCKKCPALIESRTQTVFGTGNPYSELVFIGEGPGAEEDKQGLPFVGRSGQLLNDIISKGMKLKREDIYICNIVRCRPNENRNPTSEEAASCRPFLDATLEIIQPKYICCLGSIAATNLLHSDQTIGRLRGIVHDYRGAKVICTYHPAYLLRNPPAKVQTWNDIKLLMKVMNLPLND